MPKPQRFSPGNLSVLVAIMATVVPLATAQAASTRTWIQPVGGVWSTPGAWAPYGVPGAQDSAVIPFELGTETIVLDQNTPTLGNFFLQNPATTLDLAGHVLTAADTCRIGGTVLASGSTQGLGGFLYSTAGSRVLVADGAQLSTSGSWQNDGHIVIHSTAGSSPSVFRFNYYESLSGSGDIFLTDPVNALLDGDSHWPLTQNAGHLIHGTGRITGPVINHGRVASDYAPGSALSLEGLMANDGTLSATGGARLLVEGTVNNSGGVVLADGGDVELNGGTVSYGTLRTLGTSVIETSASSSIANEVTLEGTLRVNAGTVLWHRCTEGAGVLVNNGAVIVHPSGTGSATFRTQGYVTLTGTGNLLLDDPLDALLTGDPLVQNAGHTVHGAGSISQPLTNHGLISADVSGQTLTLTNRITNDGTMQSVGGAILLLNGVTLYNTGGVLAATSGDIHLAGVNTGGGTLTSGSTNAIMITDASSMGACTNAGRILVNGGATLNVGDGNPFIDNGTMQIRSPGDTAAAIVSVNYYFPLGGTGALVLTHGSQSIITGDSHYGLTHQAPHTIRGTGQIWCPFLNNGSLIADRRDSLLTVGFSVGCPGTQMATNGGTLWFTTNTPNYGGGVLTGGTWAAGASSSIRFPAADIWRDAATIVLDGAGSDLVSADVGLSALRHLGYVDPAGSFTVRHGRQFNTNFGLTSSGIVGVGPGSVLSVGYDQPGSYTMDGNATFLVEISGRGAAGYGKLAVNGAATINGTLRARILNGFQPAMTDTFEVMDFVTRSGDFAQLDSMQVTPTIALTPVWQVQRLLLVPRLTPSDVPTAPATAAAASALGFSARGGLGGPAHLELRLPHTASVGLSLYDVIGRQMATLASGTFAAGCWTWTWGEAREAAASGVYFARARVTMNGTTRELASRFVLCR